MPNEQITIKCADGAGLAALHTPEKTPAKAVVIVSHGFGEHAAMYDECAKYLLKDGFACLILNQRGHGLLSSDSKGQKKLQGIVPGYQSFLDDIGAAVSYAREKMPGTAAVLYGHSMGGNIAVNYLLKNSRADFAVAVLESPWLGLHNEVNPVVAAIAKFCGKISPKLAIIRPLAFSDLTGDAAKAKEIETDPLYHNRISMRLFAGINEGCEYALNNADKVNIPLFIAAAKGDVIVSNAAIYKFAEKCGANAVLKEYDSRHAVHNDVKREDFYRDMIKFFEKNL
ncbi:MAG: lysophospholipase [Clostridiales bacterium]|jgi:alpha-beta hydrolase superfamily lysophospholipase|nr:lysophospholipase [Clostridiales bacterium]